MKGISVKTNWEKSKKISKDRKDSLNAFASLCFMHLFYCYLISKYNRETFKCLIKLKDLWASRKLLQNCGQIGSI